MDSEMKIKIIRDGPYLVSGNVPLEEQVIKFEPEGHLYQTIRRFPEQETYALCRCGHSRNKPYCDGNHLNTGFNGSETASREPFAERATRIEGPDLIMLDDLELCAMVRFCHQPHGDAWTMTEESDNPEYRAEAILGVWECASGRLVAIDKQTGEVIEPELEPSLAVLQDPGRECSGPIFVRGGIPVESADGTIYEIRNRMTLCRCGESENKPFCDATHMDIGFSDSEPEE